MFQTETGLTQMDFRTLVGQMWHHYVRGEWERAASCLALLEIAQSETQTDEMLELLGADVYEELASRCRKVEWRLRVRIADANNLTLAGVFFDKAGKILHLQQPLIFGAQQLGGLERLLQCAEDALGHCLLRPEEMVLQRQREALGFIGWQHLQKNPPMTSLLSTFLLDCNHSTLEPDVHEQKQSGAQNKRFRSMPFWQPSFVDRKEQKAVPAGSLQPLFAHLDKALATDCPVPLCMDYWLMEMDRAEKRRLWQRYPQAWLKAIIKATEEDKFEMRVLRRGQDGCSWLHLTDCTFSRQHQLISYTDDTIYAPDLEAMAAHLQDCRRALRLPIVDDFDFNTHL